MLFFTLGATCGMVFLVSRNWEKATRLLPADYAWYLIMCLGGWPYLTFFCLGFNIAVLLLKREQDTIMHSGGTRRDYGTMRGWPNPVNEPSEV
jgi:hypothetical protein